MTSIIDAIFGVTTSPQERATLFYACGAESHCQPIPQQGGGPGNGFYQIETGGGSGGRGVTTKCADDPVCATHAFYTGWNVKGCTAQQGQLWQTNPSQAAYLAARCAEGGGSTAANNIGAQYNESQMQTGSALALYSLRGNFSGLRDTIGNIGSGIGNAAGCIVNPASCVGQTVGGAVQGAALDTARSILTSDFIVRIAMVLGGVGIVIVSFGRLVNIDPGAVASTAAKVAA